MWEHMMLNYALSTGQGSIKHEETHFGLMSSRPQVEPIYVLLGGPQTDTYVDDNLIKHDWSPQQTPQLHCMALMI